MLFCTIIALITFIPSSSSSPLPVSEFKLNTTIAPPETEEGSSKLVAFLLSFIVVGFGAVGLYLSRSDAGFVLIGLLKFWWMAVRENMVPDMNKKKTIRRLQSIIGDVEKVEETLTSEKKKIENLRKQVECPVCLDVPRKGPIFVCPNGHIICPKCKREKCPICRVKVGNNKSIVAVALIENILHDCKFDGCDEEHPLDMIENHEKYCYHRIVTCPDVQCDQTIRLSNIMDHLVIESWVTREIGMESGAGVTEMP